MSPSSVPFRLKLLGGAELVDLFAGAYADAARSGAPMRTAAEALEAIRESIADGDVMHTLSAVDRHLGGAYGSRLQQVLVELRASILDALRAAVRRLLDQPGAAGMRGWLEAFAIAFVNGRWSLLEELMPDGAVLPKVAGMPSDGLRGFARMVGQNRWPELYEAVLGLSNEIETAQAKARLLSLAGEIQLRSFHRYQRALRDLEQAWELAPEDLQVVGRLGQWWEAWGDKTKARRDFYERQIALNPQSSAGYINIGAMLEAAGELSEAEAQYQQAITNDPGDENSYLSMMGLYGRAELYEVRSETIRELRERVWRISSSSRARLLVQEANTHLAQSRFEEARDCFGKVLREEPANLEALVGLGASAAEQGASLESADRRQAALYAEARSRFERAIQLCPTDVVGYWQMSFQEEREKRFEEALVLTGKVAELHPDWNVLCHVRAGDLKRIATRYGEAEADLMEALAQDAGNRNALEVLVDLADDLLYNANDRDGAARLFEEVGRGWGEVAREIRHNRIGNLHFFFSEFTEAADAYRRAVAAAPSDPTLRANLGRALLGVKSVANREEVLEEAVKSFRRAVGLAPQRAEYADLLAEAEAELDLNRRYGAEALELEPAYEPISVELHPALVPVVADESRSGLTERAREETQRLRERLRKRFGFSIPGIRYREMAPVSGPEGAYNIVLDGSVDGGSGCVAPQSADAMLRLTQGIEDALGREVESLVTFDAVAEMLDECESQACAEIGRDPRRLVRFTPVVRAAARGAGLADGRIAVLAARFLEVEGSGATPELVESRHARRRQIPSRAPEMMLSVGPELDERHAMLQAALQAARVEVFELTGVIAPLVKPTVNPALGAFEWVLETAGSAPRRGMQPNLPFRGTAEAKAALGDALAHALSSFSPALLSEQVVEHYLASLATQRRALVDAARKLVGVPELAARLGAHLERSGSIRNLPPILSEFVAQAADRGGGDASTPEPTGSA